MKINNTQTIQTFGYNKEYHTNVQKTLSTRLDSKSQIANYLIQMDKLANKMEDEIILLEKQDKTKTKKFEDLTTCLTDLKSTLTFFIEMHFPKLKFCDNEINEYLKEIETTDNQDKQYWRKNICLQLKKYTNTKFPTLAKKETTPVENHDKNQKTNSNKNEFTKAVNQVIDSIKERKAKEETENELLTAITPNEFTPKSLNDVIGLENLKEKFQSNIIDYIKNPQLYEQDKDEYGLKQPKTYLLYGPPGCGKTFIAQALASEIDAQMYKMDVSKIGSKYVNESANNIDKAFNKVFQIADQSEKPTVLFMDEVDSLAIQRSESFGGSSENLKTTSTLLKFLDKAKEKKLIIIAATNKYDLLDGAFKDRFEEQEYVPLPSKEEIINLIKRQYSNCTKGTNLANNNEALEIIAKKLKGFSNRSIVTLLNEAAKNAKKDSRSEIKLKHVKQAIETTEIQKINEEEYKKKNNASIGFED